ncbi:hypothetical protein BOQ63_000640 (plasmid) [Streptomyces viridifaciens]|nr:hypothetical protein BOQ63_000640 [Streptomyces viridifaciens]
MTVRTRPLGRTRAGRERGVVAVRDGDALIRDRFSARHGPHLLRGLGGALR